MAEKLFAEFPPVSTPQWEEVIAKDLKGADYEKKLVWKTQEGFAVLDSSATTRLVVSGSDSLSTHSTLA
jgi:hypothetical protein